MALLKGDGWEVRSRGQRFEAFAGELLLGRSLAVLILNPVGFGPAVKGLLDHAIVQRRQ